MPLGFFWFTDCIGFLACVSDHSSNSKFVVHKEKTKSMVGDLIPLTVFFLLIIISYLYAFFFNPFFFHLNLRDVKILMLF